jgi:exosome complex RNA-binding protein Rrp42 (RNase PH superfamily)
MQGARMGSRAALVADLLQRLLADSAAVDLEALVIRKGRQAWTLYLDITMINASGALQDAAVFAAVAALSAFRLPQAEVKQVRSLSLQFDGVLCASVWSMFPFETHLHFACLTRHLQTTMTMFMPLT